MGRLYSWVTVRRLTFRRPAVTGIGMAALSVVAGGVLAVASRAPGPAPSSHQASSHQAATHPASSQPTASKDGGGAGAIGPTPPRLVVPDVIASVPGGVTPADLAKLNRIGQVRAVLPIAGGRIAVNGRPLTVLGAPAARLRPWTPPDTAARTSVWSRFAAGDLITTSGAARAAGLRAGRAYPVSAAVRTGARFGGSALLGVTGVDAVVSDTEARRLGLVRNFAVLVNAPAANMVTLTGQVRSALGPGAKVVRLVPVSAASAGENLPVDSDVPVGRPTSYLDLYKASAARYCPGLSWTVLASIGQIESGNGANVGPSSAGALGPMQFEPSTWKIWGMTGFGETGPPNIMDPFDAVPSAARMLCADGAADGGPRLRSAIFDYNHATWYVDEVLTLAGEYASEFGR